MIMRLGFKAKSTTEAHAQQKYMPEIVLTGEYKLKLYNCRSVIDCILVCSVAKTKL